MSFSQFCGTQIEFPTSVDVFTARIGVSIFRAARFRDPDRHQGHRVPAEVGQKYPRSDLS
jgi:hypothetical protein